MENIRLNHFHYIKVNKSVPQRRKFFMILNTEIKRFQVAQWVKNMPAM